MRGDLVVVSSHRLDTIVASSYRAILLWFESIWLGFDENNKEKDIVVHRKSLRNPGSVRMERAERSE
jgi:hypothetical protein